MPKDTDFITLEFLKSIDQEVEDHQSYVRYMSNVARGIRYYRATQEWWIPSSDFEDEDVADSAPTARENVIRTTVDELNSLLLKNDPIVRTHPFHPEDAMLSDDMDSILLAAWRNAKTRHHFRTMQKMSAICGLGVCKTGWNVANKNIHPKGEVGIQFISPTDIYLDPYASNAHRGLDCRYIRHTSWQTPEAIIYRYGNEGAKALNIASETGRPGKWEKSLGWIRQKIINTVTGETKGNDRVDRRFPVYEYWIFPVHGRESELVTGEMVDEKSYPYGIVVTLVNDTIIRTIPNPYYRKKRVKMGEGLNARSRTVEVGHRMHPFCLLYWNREMDSEGYNGLYDCVGMVQEQIPYQQSLNAVNRDLEHHIRTTAWPGMFAYEDAFDTPLDRIEGRPGEVIEMNSKYGSRNIGEVVQQFQGRTMSSEAWNYRNDKREKIGLVAGMKPHMIGLAPQGTSHTPAATVGTLQEASFSAMWSPNDEITAACEDIAYRYLGLIQQYYDSGRVVQISEEGGIATYIEIESNHLAARFRLEVVSGTTTPLYDMDKETKLMGISQKVDAALMTQNVQLMKSCLIYLDNLNNPYTYQWVQLLKQSIADVELSQQTLAGMGGLALQEQQGAQQSLPPAGEPGLEDLAAALGTSPEELESVLQSE